MTTYEDIKDDPENFNPGWIVQIRATFCNLRMGIVCLSIENKSQKCSRDYCPYKVVE